MMEASGGLPNFEFFLGTLGSAKDVTAAGGERPSERLVSVLQWGWRRVDLGWLAKMPMDMANKNCMPMVKAMILLDSEGKRITVKYYSKEWALSVKEQSNFERSLFVKTCRTNARGEPEIIMFDNHVIVYKFVADVFFYVVAGTEENEIALAQVLQALTESTSTLLRNSVEKKSILENLDLVLIAMDEIVDNGIIFETDSAQVASRVTMRGKDEGFGNISDQTLSQAFASAKEQFSKHMLR